MDKTEKRICGYSSLLIALMMNSPKLLALRENGIIAHYWHFDLAELSFQTLYNFVFCLLLFYFNLQSMRALSTYGENRRYGRYFAANGLLILFSMIVGTFVQYHLFAGNRLPRVFWLGYCARFGLSTLLIGILIKIVLLLRESKATAQENEQLKNAYLEAQLQLLKEQLNPHLLFNSLSSLSGIVREDPKLAQFYIYHLSKVFRHALARSGTELITLAEELTMLKSYEQLLKMRFEQAFELKIAVDDDYLETRIPHLSLQPLLENAAKHNSATVSRPLSVHIYTEGDWLIVSNNLQQIAQPENSTGLGLVNLNERFKILMRREIELIKTAEQFLVKLPLK